MAKMTHTWELTTHAPGADPAEMQKIEAGMKKHAAQGLAIMTAWANGLHEAAGGTAPFTIEAQMKSLHHTP